MRDAILNAREPDDLIFAALPAACADTGANVQQASAAAKTARLDARLGAALLELQGAYGDLLSRCQDQLADKFGISATDLRALRSELKHHAHPLAATLLGVETAIVRHARLQ